MVAAYHPHQYSTGVHSSKMNTHDAALVEYNAFPNVFDERIHPEILC